MSKRNDGDVYPLHFFGSDGLDQSFLFWFIGITMVVWCSGVFSPLGLFLFFRFCAPLCAWKREKRKTGHGARVPETSAARANYGDLDSAFERREGPSEMQQCFFAWCVCALWSLRPSRDCGKNVILRNKSRAKYSGCPWLGRFLHTLNSIPSWSLET